MKHGDFTKLAEAYQNRAGYARSVLANLMQWSGVRSGDLVADVGAGTGKLTEDLVALGLRVHAVEPNDAMRAIGQQNTATLDVQWSKGSAEETTLPAGLTRWLLMGSSFHWTDPQRSLPEFHRVLQPGGCFTAVWNPRHIEGNELHERIEQRINQMIPDLKRVSSGGRKYTERMFDVLVSTGHFEDVVCVVARDAVAMTPQRYLGAWQSVNDIQVQAGPERWPKVLGAIEEEIAGLAEVVVPYETRSFTARRIDRR